MLSEFQIVEQDNSSFSGSIKFVLQERHVLFLYVNEHNNIIVRDAKGHTPMSYIPWDEVDAFVIMKLLVDAGANLSDQNFQVKLIITGCIISYLTIIIVQDYLQVACSRGYSDNVSLLLKYGAKADSESLTKALAGGYEYVIIILYIAKNFLGIQISWIDTLQNFLGSIFVDAHKRASMYMHNLIYT